jgi:hypothetical protein
MGCTGRFPGDEVVRVADDELFGPDGTQEPPSPPFFADPLSGLVTGSLFSDTTSVADVSALYPDYVYTPAAARLRRRAPAAPPRQTGPLQAAGTPAAIPVAAPLAKSFPRRPPAARGTPAVTAPARIAPVRPIPTQTGWPTRQAGAALTGRAARTERAAAASGRTQSTAKRDRRASAGCSIFLVLIVILVVVFVVLGIVLGHSTGGTSGFSTGGGG